MRTDFQRVLAFYEDQAASELERAGRPGVWFEMQRTLTVFERHAPEACDVLDLGAGSGRYAIELARRGHRVVAADLSASLLQHAKEQAVQQDLAIQCDVVNAVDLSRYEDQSFDCVLALGGHAL